MAVETTPDAEQETPHSAAYVAFRAAQKQAAAAYWQAFWDAKLGSASATSARDAVGSDLRHATASSGEKIPSAL